MAWKVRSAPGVSLVVAGLLMQPGLLLAQSPPQGADDAALTKKLAQSERRVRTLQQRVDRLERRLDALMQAQQAAAARPEMASGYGAGAGAGEAGHGRADMHARAMMAGPPMEGAPPGHGRPEGGPPPMAQAQPPAHRPGPPGGGERRAKPGSFEVDEDAAERALERTLTQAGALLLPPGAVTVQPSFSYVRQERSAGVLGQVTDPATGATGLVVLNQDLRRNEYTLRANVKAGMPWETQLEAELPYQHVSSSRVDGFGGATSGSGSGLGDFEIGIAKTLLRERGLRPDLIGRLTYNSGSGDRNDGLVALQGGYRGLTAELVALKRQDPLAFFAALSYGVSHEKSGIKPGALTNFSIGTVLAASPATSLQFGFNQTRRQRQELDGVRLPGSEQTYGTFSLGASSVLSRDMMLITTLGVGMGSDAPRYSLNVALPITFR